MLVKYIYLYKYYIILKNQDLKYIYNIKIEGDEEIKMITKRIEQYIHLKTLNNRV